jgi:hypothetical protein
MRRPARVAAPVAKRRPPVLVGTIVGGALVVVAVIVFLAVRNAKTDARDAGAASASATTPAAPPPSPKDSAAPTNADSKAPAPVDAPNPPPPPPPALDAAAVDRRIAELATAADLVAYGDLVRSQSADASLADRCYAKALALEPANETAKQRLDVRKLSLTRDLPGWDDVATSKAMYRARPFEALADVEMSRPERAKQVAAWEEAKKALDERIALQEKDPFIGRLDGVLNNLRDKPFFKDLQFEVVESIPPYALVVQVKGDAAERKKRVEAVEKAYRPYLLAYDKKIHDWLLPLSPKPPKRDPTFVTWILLDSPDYDRYFLESSGHARMPGMRAHYERETKRAITYSPSVDPRSGEFGEGAQALLHELTHAWVDRLATIDDGKTYDLGYVQTHWFSEGIAEYMSCQFMDRDGKVHFQPWRSARVSEAAHKKRRIPLKEALAMRSTGELENRARLFGEEAAKDPKQQLMIQVEVSSGFYADMALFICWLTHADHGASRERFESYVQDELRGDGEGAFDKRFGSLLDDLDLEKTIDEFAKRVASGAEAFDEE